MNSKLNLAVTVMTDEHVARYAKNPSFNVLWRVLYYNVGPKPIPCASPEKTVLYTDVAGCDLAKLVRMSRQ